ncbi:sperm histone [Salpingoeca rosetta]|uniref:Sperm histone n=1 Tax=Salpingoeca rosetta (strain ATCC 50818 / BSB-021) TaxID=946362 RepID=F2UPN2_SALR5|nr:sperm histone [Salpingoeca rosetta]EGD79587.1 sperm histone [Salpingoeca rosetta]|eukprot:XP_004988815.1 sperm histone [Salpingoeca rosetta]
MAGLSTAIDWHIRATGDGVAGAVAFFCVLVCLDGWEQTLAPIPDNCSILQPPSYQDTDPHQHCVPARARREAGKQAQTRSQTKAHKKQRAETHATGRKEEKNDKEKKKDTKKKKKKNTKKKDTASVDGGDEDRSFFWHADTAKVIPESCPMGSDTMNLC